MKLDPEQNMVGTDDDFCIFAERKHASILTKLIKHCVKFVVPYRSTEANQKLHVQTLRQYSRGTTAFMANNAIMFPAQVQ